jgi:hypothetical protein
MRVCIRTASLVTLKDDAIRISVGLLNGEGIGDDDFKEITSLFFATVKVRAEPARVRARASDLHASTPPRSRCCCSRCLTSPTSAPTWRPQRRRRRTGSTRPVKRPPRWGAGKRCAAASRLALRNQLTGARTPRPRPALSRLCAQSLAAARRARNHITYNYLAQALLQAPAASDEQKDAVFVSMTQLRAFHQLVGTAYR